VVADLRPSTGSSDDKGLYEAAGGPRSRSRVRRRRRG
jgi:hypothetical protein